MCVRVRVYALHGVNHTYVSRRDETSAVAVDRQKACVRRAATDTETRERRTDQSRRCRLCTTSGTDTFRTGFGFQAP